jgi:ubiquinone/menaquinone biosynthesis C-methylase UbiE
MPKTQRKKVTRSSKADQYDDPNFNYLHYWNGRDYENESERIALTRLLKDQHFKHAADVGGGYGRLCVFLKNYADKVTLAEPSQQQLDIGKDFLKGHKGINMILTQADDLKLKDNSIDLITMIRVMHHLPDPSVSFAEVKRVLTDDGWFILEIANNTHFLNRVRYTLKGKKLPKEPVDIRTGKNRSDTEIAFVNHNPRTVIKQLAHEGLKVEKILSVSNLRSPALKKIMPRPLMLSVEKAMQVPLAKSFFGPSTFLLIKKAS